MLSLAPGVFRSHFVAILYSKMIGFLCVCHVRRYLLALFIIPYRFPVYVYTEKLQIVKKQTVEKCIFVLNLIYFLFPGSLVLPPAPVPRPPVTRRRGLQPPLVSLPGHLPPTLLTDLPPHLLAELPPAVLADLPPLPHAPDPPHLHADDSPHLHADDPPSVLRPRQT